MCKDEIILVNNQFSIDFDSNKVIKYSDIKDLKLNDKSIKIDFKNQKEELFFEKISESESFYKKLKESLN